LTGESLVEQVLQTAVENGYRRIGSLAGSDFRLWFLKQVLAASREVSSQLLSGPKKRFPATSQQGALSGETLTDAGFLDAMWTLPPRLRAPLFLVEVEGLTYTDAAWVIDVPPSSMKALLAEGRACLAVSRLPH